jgi:hypothetical protein
MLKEIYILNQFDVGYEPNKIDESDSVRALIQKIKMIMFTRKGEILGDPMFGISLEDLLFEVGVSSNDLKRAFDQQIGTYIPEAGQFDLRLEVNFVPGTVRDVAFIDIYVNGTKAFGVVAQ